MVDVGLILMAVTAFALGGAAEVWVIPMIAGGGLKRPNYAGRLIPVASGLSFVLASGFVIALGTGLGLVTAPSGLPYLVGFYAVALLGLVDDTLGSRSTTGLAGHLQNLVTACDLSTGALKAIYGGAVSAVVALFLNQSLLTWLIHTLMIALSTNALNLFDLRPGRAAKVFLTGAVALSFFGDDSRRIVVPTAFALLAYLPADLRARAMMGDTGSNPLGFTLGFAAAVGLSAPWKWATLASLIVLHVYAERASLSQLIERVPLLRILDEWGRPRPNQ